MMTDKQLTIPKHIAIFIGGSKLKPISEVMTLSPNERFEQAVLGDHLELIGILYKGYCLLGLKEELGHGSYMQGLASRHIEPTGAWRAQSLAKLSLRVSSSNFAALQNMSPTKLALLVKWTDDELSRFFSGDEVKGLTYDIANVIASREMERQLKKADLSDNELQQALDKSQDTNSNLEQTIRMLQKQKSNLGEFQYPPSIDKIRVESSIMASQMVSFLDDFEQLMVELQNASDLDLDRDKRESQFSAGAGALYINLKSVAVKSSYLMTVFAKAIDASFIPDKPEDVPVMDESEATRIHDTHAFLLAQSRVTKPSRSSKRKDKK